MRAGELCIRDVVTAHEDESALVAARRMTQLHVGDLVVVQPRPFGPPLPIGMVTDRDLVVQVMARGRAPSTTKVREIMHHEVVTVTEEEDIEAAAARMRAHAVRRLPVVDRNGALQGVLSLDDVIGWLGEQLQTATELLEKQSGGPRIHAYAT